MIKLLQSAVWAALFIPIFSNAQNDCQGIDDWNSTDIYLDNDQAVYNGSLYEANWWSQNQNPEYNSGQYQVWTPLGACGSSQEPETVKFIFPLEAPGVSDNFTYWNIGSYPDLDPSSGIIDYNGGNATYNNHHGTDIGLGANGWTRMDLEIVNVIAAADGIIVDKHDGEYDRRCGGSHNPGGGNYIKLLHADSTYSIYAHLKKNSLTSKIIGDAVVAGEFLGKVGSSGNSSGPHLHFDVRDINNKLIDPNHSDPAQSRWINPLPYLPSAMPDIIVSDEDISYIDSCGANYTHDFQSEFFTRKDQFFQGDRVLFFRFYNNTRDNQSTNPELIRPDGTTAWSYTDNITVNWQVLITVRSHDLATNAQTGTWTFRETYNGVTYESQFEVLSNSTTPNTGCQAEAWSASEIYHTGDVVEYNGNIYVAQWSWIENQANPEISAPWGAWSLTGSCGSSMRFSAASNDLNGNSEVKLYPNPASDQVVVSVKGEALSGEISIQVYNVQGIEIMNTQESVLDVSGLERGVYIVTVKSAMGTTREKLILE